MDKFNMLLELQKNYDIIKESSKELNGGSYIYLLKKVKDDFEATKIKFKDKENEINRLKEQYKEINSKLVNSRKEIEKNEYALYHNTGSDFKLIQGLEKKIEEQKRNINELDNTTLELLEQEDKLSFERDNLRVKLAALKKEFESVKDAGNKKISNAKTEIEKAQENIERISKELSPAILKKFKDLEESKGSAAAKSDNGVCQGCKMRISAVTADKIKKGYNVVYCDNCGRILYYNDIEEQPK